MASRYAQVEDLRAFSKRAGSLDKEIRKALAKETRTVLKPTVTQIKRNIRSLPSKQTAASRRGRPKLRSEIAKVVKSKASASSAGFAAEVWVAGSKMPAGRQNLPLLMEGGGRGRWRFPVFPKSKDAGTWTWRSQKSRPYFNPVIQKNTDGMLEEIHGAVEVAVLRHLGIK